MASIKKKGGKLRQPFLFQAFHTKKSAGLGDICDLYIISYIFIKKTKKSKSGAQPDIKKIYDCCSCGPHYWII